MRGGRIRGAVLHPWLAVRVQIALGVIFIVAALPKLVDPPSFAHMIYNYRILPGPLVNLAALSMPWIELTAGLALILGIWRRSAAALIGGMLLVFIVAISLNLARGHAIGCGCFEVKGDGPPPSRAQLIEEMRFVIYRDVGMLLMVAHILAATRRRDAGETGSDAVDAALFPMVTERRP